MNAMIMICKPQKISHFWVSELLLWFVCRTRRTRRRGKSLFRQKPNNHRWTIKVARNDDSIHFNYAIGATTRNANICVQHTQVHRGMCLHGRRVWVRAFIVWENVDSIRYNELEILSKHDIFLEHCEASKSN